LERVPALPGAEKYIDEATIIMATGAAKLLSASMAAAALATGASLALNRQNFNGEFLNACATAATDQTTAITGARNQFFKCTSSQSDGVAMFFYAALSEIHHVTGLVFDPLSLVQDGWCSNFTNLGPAGAANLW